MSLCSTGGLKPSGEGRKVSPITDTTRLPPGALLGSMMKAGESIEGWGQRELLEAQGAALPIKGSEHPSFTKVGFKFGDAFDSAFREAQLPAGWQLVAGETEVLSKFLDAKGRTRGQVHYKAAQRGRFAEMGLHSRYSVKVEYQGEFGKVGESHRAYVFDNATQTELFSTRTLRREGKDRKFLKTEELREEAAQWLAEHYAAYEDPAAYWE